MIYNTTADKSKRTTGYTQLHFAVKRNLPEHTIKLIKEGANVNATDGGGWTPLHLAVYFGDFIISEILLKNGANPNATDNGLWTPLHLASRHSLESSHKCVELLLKYGAYVDAKNDQGKSALVLAERGNINQDGKYNGKNNKTIQILCDKLFDEMVINKKLIF